LTATRPGAIGCRAEMQISTPAKVYPVIVIGSGASRGMAA
jgi:hypothetical protein